MTFGRAWGRIVALRKVSPFHYATQLGSIRHKRVMGQMYLLKLKWAVSFGAVSVGLRALRHQDAERTASLARP
jgi:hypothetical protein